MSFCFIGVSAMADSCADGAGFVVQGTDGTEYCASLHTMNWWSAFAWCDAQGKKLFDPNEECHGRGNIVRNLPCPNVVGYGGYLWTSSLERNGVPLAIKEGRFFTYLDHSKNDSNYALAFCQAR